MCWCCSKESDSESTDKTVLKPRGCTDVFCLAVFITFWAVLIFVAAFAFVVGNPLRLVKGFDSFGNICGMDNRGDNQISSKKNNQTQIFSLSGLDMTDKPYVFYFDLHNLKDCFKICVKKCPEQNLKNMKELVKYESETGIELCRYDFYFNENLALTYDRSNGNYSACPKFEIFKSKPVLNRCVPTTIKELLYNVTAYVNSVDILQQGVGDLYASWKEIVGLSVLALVLSFIMVVLIHYLASFISWIIMIVVSVAFIASTALLWWTYVGIKFELDSTPFEKLLEKSAKNERAFLCYSIIATILTVILLLVVCVIRKRVKLVVALFREAGACIKSMPCLLLQPLWTFMALLTFFIYWMIVMVALATAEYARRKSVSLSLNTSIDSGANEMIDARNGIVDREIELIDFYNADPSWVRYMWWFHLLGLIWTSEFILACQQMVIAGAVSYWYFSRNRKEVKYPILMSTYKLIVYHLGSVALGSFIITLVKIPRIILTYLQTTLKKYNDNACAKCCLKCCNCCLWCLEKCIRYLNHNAYTIVAIDGIGFCPAARIAFQALVSNALRVATINSVGDFILFLGKCAIAAITGFAGLLLMKHDPDLHFYAIPIFVCVLFAFFIGHCVLSVYEMVIDTLFLCFCEDYDKNDGTPGKEYYAPPSLLVFLTKRNIQDSGPIEQSEPLQTFAAGQEDQLKE
ncbi:SLC44A1 (predicted) [Pycnogonum litorale]